MVNSNLKRFDGIRLLLLQKTRIHCGSSHNCNDPKCSVVKSFRASLTRKLLSIFPTSSYSTDCPADFPRLASAQFASIPNTITNSILLKLDVINKCMNNLNDNIEILARKTEQFEKFMADKIESDIQFDERIQALEMNKATIDTNVKQQHRISTRHENMFMKLVLPILDEVMKFTASLNRDNGGRVMDADFRAKMDRMRAQLNNCTQGKNFQ
ncbi:unnamed protein product [Didymodactylos carnosus]|uniref:Uncharacterized protein n=1 Tax=Didymodactylos carnosus TaxID=1234261 RepID=A0A8S2DC21_9BILA|nr:unnamed protein product [Didymodactylos carnosus]CAF3704652.1 unnamed protein product [Didymodactylos carnosus]